MRRAGSLVGDVVAGRALEGAFIASCHAHLGVGWNHPTNGWDGATMARTMDALGIDVSCVSSMRALGPDLVGGNAELARAVRADPARYVGAVVFNPHFPAESIAAVERYFATGDFGMVKIHPEFHAYPMNGPRYCELYRLAAAQHIPVLTHSWGLGPGPDHPDLARSIADTFPDLRLILAHSGGTPDGLRASVEVAKRYPHIYLDTGTTFMFRGALEYQLDSIGPDRILFGTDAVYIADAPQVARVVGSNIDEDVQRRILSGNLVELLSDPDINLDREWARTNG